MTARVAVHAIFLFSFLGFSQDITITITHPDDAASIGQQEMIRGEVTGTDKGVFILVHPKSTKMWYVQDKPSAITEQGTWQAVCYFGDEYWGVGETFEVLAIVTKKKLRAGSSLRRIPKNAIRSEVITVKRTR